MPFVLRLLGLVGVVWSAISLPVFCAELPTKGVVARILIDDSFRLNVLNELLAAMSGERRQLVQRSDHMRAEGLIRLRIAEGPVAWKRSEEVDQDTASAIQSIRWSLAMNPADSFMWMTLYTLESAYKGSGERAVAYLDQSYVVGPFEGWIILRRNKTALAAFSSLDSVAQQKVSSEFAAIVEAGFTDVALHNLTSVGWSHKNRLLAGLQRSDIASRQLLAKRLADQGFEVDVPGVAKEAKIGR
ncbi:hypothetical protein [Bradyrhizobium ottawaense]|uniref:hypothetical protein n=1 Tax=Bradyrhizobium ottawaense TaxID=931866 RepID=UPI001BAE362B|nr:hypothetical protein [Bradyrhizobium ottawaense]MBR1335191.1 hypothetical protein [Bradyrhizobium ottawaense]